MIKAEQESNFDIKIIIMTAAVISFPACIIFGICETITKHDTSYLGLSFIFGFGLVVLLMMYFRQKTKSEGSQS